MSVTTYKKKDEEINEQPTTIRFSTYTPGFGFKKPDTESTEQNPEQTPATQAVQPTVQNIVPSAAKTDNSLAQVAAAKSFSYNGSKPTYASPYSAQIDRLFNEIQNNPEFSYDPEGDALYQALKGQYTALGQQAMKDTSAQIAAQTGGIASSYAASAGAQAYNNYMNQLAGYIPELQQLAYEMYQNDLNQKYQQFDALNALENQAYGKYRDELSDYYTDYNNAYNQFINEQNQQNYLNEIEYQKQQNELAQQNWQKQFDYQAQQDLLKQQNYLNEIEYERYLNDIAQQNWEKQFGYQAQQDSLSQQNWQTQFDYQKYLNDIEQQNYETERAYEKEQDLLDRAWDEAFAKAGVGDLSGLTSLGIDISNYGTAAGADEDDYDPYSDETIAAYASEFRYKNVTPENGAPIKKLLTFEEQVQQAREALSRNEIDTEQFNLIVEELYNVRENEDRFY